MRQVIRGGSTNMGAAVLLGGAIAACAGLCWLFSNQAGESRRRAAKENSRARRDYFRIVRIGSGGEACWLLEGFGAYECSLRFGSWNEAMNQVRFRLETLASPSPERYPPAESAPTVTGCY